MKRVLKDSDKVNIKKSVFEDRARLMLWMAIIVVIIMDAVFLYQLVSRNRSEAEYENINSAKAVEYVFRNSIESAAQIATNLSMNRDLDVFLENRYFTPEFYYDEYVDAVKSAQLNKMYSFNNVNMEVYADNETLINGGGVYKMSTIKNEQWYKDFVASGEDSYLVFTMVPDKRYPSSYQRSLYYVRWMKYYPGARCKKLCKIEINYGTLCKNIETSVYDIEALLCQNDKIVISSAGNNNKIEPFEDYVLNKKDYSRKLNFYGNEFYIVIPDSEKFSLNIFRNNSSYMLLLILVNILFPIVFIRIGHIIQEGKIKEQEMDIARQNAELLALHSQINPHFLFNALESIRMHSLLRGETETAEMVEKLAVIERKNADWNEDETTIEDEMIFVDAYLKLQQYRFAERLSYEINIEEACRKLRIPRLTIVTFVENACVHGIEGKSSPGWIFISVYRKDDDIVIEVEDTGGGMEQSELEELKDKMVNASLDRLKTKGRIGVINACLRLKMFSGGSVRFEVDSEEGVGTTIQVFIPSDVIEKNMNL